MPDISTELKVGEIEKLSLRDQLGLERTLRIYKWAMGKPQPPFKLVLTPTDRCNLNCVFCPNYTAREMRRFKIEEEFSKEEWLDIVKQALDLGVLQWCVLGGGEPLLRSEPLLSMLQLICERSKLMDFEIITNGTLLNEDLIKGMFEIARKKVEIHPVTKLKKELGMLQITISIHGLRDTYKFITQVDMFERVIENLKLIANLKEKLNLEQPTVQINILLNKKNLGEILDLIKFLGGVKVNQTVFHVMRGYEETKDVIKNIELSEDDWKIVPKLVNQAKIIAKNYGIHVGTDPIDAHMEGPLKFNQEAKNDFTHDKKIDKNKTDLSQENILSMRCYEPWYNILINPNGNVSRCAAYSTRREPINIKKMSLKKIWFGEFFTQIRKNIVRNIEMEGCSRCGLLTNTRIVRRDLVKFLNERKIILNV
jgi:radical SAM protein with 4Fe4S-binding SPASM domain